MYNLVQLIGRLTAKPELTETESEKKVCHISLAVQRGFKNADGIYEADFIRCTLWDAIAARACEYCDKGDLVAIRGQLRVSSYNEGDELKYMTEVVAEKLVFLSSKKIDDVEDSSNDNE